MACFCPDVPLRTYSLSLIPFSNYLTLNNIVTWKSGLEVTQCHCLGAIAVSYSPSIVTMAISVAVCEIFSVKQGTGV